jgi:hypothetical protein
VSLLVALVTGTPASAADEAVIGEVLQILKERGLVDESRYNELVLKNERYEEEQQSLLGRIEWSGDLRGRMENFWFDEDDLGNDFGNRTRLRYRLRLSGVATINEWMKAGFRLSSGERVDFDEGDNRSTNRTLGKDNDFGLDTVFIDRAYLQASPPEGYLPTGSELTGRFGKVPNPFLWDHGKDYMLWDHDINPEGVSLAWSHAASDLVDVYANGGYFIMDENSRARDPHVIGVQGGAAIRPGEDVELGGRLSWYGFRSLDGAFLLRARANGATPDLTDDMIHVGELAAYLRYDGVEDWPILIYGHFAHNFSAEDVLDSQQDTGWGVGVEVGDKKKYAKLGLGYYQIEANFWPGQFVDSDIFDATTNRKAWTLYAGRQILPNTELNVTLFWSDDLETELPLYAVGTRGADRVRLQTDVVVKF